MNTNIPMNRVWVSRLDGKEILTGYRGTNGVGKWTGPVGEFEANVDADDHFLRSKAWLIVDSHFSRKYREMVEMGKKRDVIEKPVRIHYGPVLDVGMGNDSGKIMPFYVYVETERVKVTQNR